VRLLVSTRNPGKLAEIKAIFDLPVLVLSSALDVPGLPEVEEDGDTLEANAVKKAEVLARRTEQWTLADDTGLEVDALGGAPGVRSARYAGEDGNAVLNCIKLLSDLADTEDRRARFRTVIALADPSGDCRCVEGSCPGVITREARGDGGFGYDPLFQPDGFGVTFAEMDAGEKNRISHRARALVAAKEAWGEVLASGVDRWPD
jgi:XTP/dITP diphosphohydrolase